ncbi:MULTISPECIES: type II toxin-antitoxin system VapC family toxin [Olivibacter]|uniref:Ribonuclease VapC n=2 Tax=Sphingobacteriaceae TaxID=84566 RepID=F4C975_SPHS2
MTGNNLLLDTNIVIELFKGNPIVIKKLSDREKVDIPHVVLAELLLGAYRSSNPKKHLSQIRSFLSKCNVIRGDIDTADAYAVIKAALLKKGKPIPENDIWIASIAKQHNLTLITKDKHFKEIQDVQIESW